MKLGIIADLRNPAINTNHRPWAQHYSEFIDLIEQLEKIGFDQVMFPEHHFEEDGYVPNPIPLMTAVAMKTRKMLVGADLFRLPDWHPVRLAEDVAMVDILSNGRVLFKAGAGGIYPRISAGLGWDPKKQLSRSAETLQIILKCWSEEIFDWDGTHYKLKGVRATPKPVQTPHPPIFMPANNARSIERNAREGYGSAMAADRWTWQPIDGAPSDRGSFDWWKNWHHTWTNALERHGRTSAECPSSAFMKLFCTDDPERAWARHKKGVLYVTHSYDKMRDEPTQPNTPEELPHWDKVFMTPDAMVKMLNEFFGDARPENLLLWDVMPGMTYDESYESHKLFMEEVWPHIQGFSD